MLCIFILNIFYVQTIITTIVFVLGACGNYNNYNSFDDLKEVAADIPKAIQLEEFLTRRMQFCPSDSNLAKEKKIIFWKLFVFEMLYLWNALPSCSNENITLIINGEL